MKIKAAHNILWLFFVFPIVICFVASLEKLYDIAVSSPFQTLTLLSGVFLFSGILVPITKKKLLSISGKKFLLIVMVLSFSISMVSVIAFDSLLMSDFLRYHLVAEHLSPLNPVKLFFWIPEFSISETLREFATYQSVLVNTLDFSEAQYNSYPTLVYLKRILFYLYPVYYVFGPHKIVGEFLNIFLHLLTGINLYFFIKFTLKDYRVARLALMFYFLIPIGYLILNIPSHDTPGLFLLSLFYVAFSWWLHKDTFFSFTVKNCIFSGLLGIIIFISDVQRSIGLFLFLSLAFYIFSMSVQNFKNKKKNSFAILFLILIPFLIYKYSYKLFNFPETGNVEIKSALFSKNDTSGNNSWGETVDNRFIYFPQIDSNNAQIGYALGKVGNEIYYNPIDFIKMLHRKIITFYSFGDEQFWIMEREHGKVEEQTQKILFTVSIIIRLLLFSFVIIGSLHLINNYDIGNPFSVALFFWFIYSNLMLFFEVQPRYSFPLKINVCIFAAIGMLAIRQFIKNKPDERYTLPIVSSLKTSLMTIITVCIICVAAYFPFCALWKHSDYYFLNTGEYQFNSTVHENLPKKNILLKGKPQEKAFKFGFHLNGNYQKGDFVEFVWEKKVRPNKKYKFSGFLVTTESKGLSATLKLNDTEIIAKDISEMDGYELYIMKQMRVKYIESEPTLATADKISVTLRMRVDEDNLRDIENISKVYLNYVQIVEAG